MNNKYTMDIQEALDRVSEERNYLKQLLRNVRATLHLSPEDALAIDAALRDDDTIPPNDVDGVLVSRELAEALSRLQPSGYFPNGNPVDQLREMLDAPAKHRLGTIKIFPCIQNTSAAGLKLQYGNGCDIESYGSDCEFHEGVNEFEPVTYLSQNKKHPQWYELADLTDNYSGSQSWSEPFPVYRGPATVPAPLKIGHGVTVKNIGFGSDEERKPYLVFAENGNLTEVNLVDVSMISRLRSYTVKQLEELAVRVAQPAPVAVVLP